MTTSKIPRPGERVRRPSRSLGILAVPLNRKRRCPYRTQTNSGCIVGSQKLRTVSRSRRSLEQEM